MVFELSDETAETSDVACSCESSADVPPNVDDSKVRETIEPVVDSDSGAPVDANDSVLVECDATVVSETCA